MKATDKSRLPGALGSGLYRGQPSKPHNWSGDWHLRPRKAPGGPSESFAFETLGKPARRPVRAMTGNFQSV